MLQNPLSSPARFLRDRLEAGHPHHLRRRPPHPEGPQDDSAQDAQRHLAQHRAGHAGGQG